MLKTKITKGYISGDAFEEWFDDKQTAFLYATHELTENMCDYNQRDYDHKFIELDVYDLTEEKFKRMLDPLDGNDMDYWNLFKVEEYSTIDLINRIIDGIDKDVEDGKKKLRKVIKDSPRQREVIETIYNEHSWNLIEQLYDMNDADEVLPNQPWEVLRLAFYGYDRDSSTIYNDERTDKYMSFCPNRSYFYFDGAGHLVSTDYGFYNDYLIDWALIDTLINDRDEFYIYDLPNDVFGALMRVDDLLDEKERWEDLKK